MTAGLRPRSSGQVPDTRRPFRRILVANRGEIALRIVRACHELGCEAVAIYSDADRAAAHVREADVAIRVGPAPAVESYLKIEAIVDAAIATDADAVHPGYGFLSERRAFAEAVEAAGLTFIGPRPETIEALGDKLAARRLAASVGVPVVPGTLEPADVEAAETNEARGRSRAPRGSRRVTAAGRFVAEAAAVGYPLLVKAAAGGGGGGMRRVDRPADLPAALVTASREAAAAFGDGAVYLERLVTGARHVEVQLVGDEGGTVVAIGERDCSLQRRHQKLIEEAPAPLLDPAERAAVHEMAVRVASAARLRNVATAEFLYEGGGQFWFLEMNTRLQVEHGVTELVTGIDLVHEQIRLAAGQPLSPAVLGAAASAAAPLRHSIEARLSAEDPAREFAPTPGRVMHWRMPAGPGVRVDTAIERGAEIPPEYDPLIAKILVVAEDRTTALARLCRVAGEVEIAGIQTTLPFIRFVAGDPSFARAEISTDWVAEHWDGPAERSRAVRAALLAAGLDALDSFRHGTGGAVGSVAIPAAAPAGSFGDERGPSAWRLAGRPGSSPGERR